MTCKQATIIGGHGFVGRALAARLIDDGWDVWIPEKNEDAVFERELGMVFYCAGLTADYATRPFDTVDAHVSLLNNILRLSTFVHLVYLSSTRVYDGQTGRVDEMSDLRVNPNNPRHIYDLSKLLGESACLKSEKASVARLACVYQDETDLDGFLPQILRQIMSKTDAEIVIETSPFFERDYVCLRDVVSALISIANHAGNAIYNVASGENTSNFQLFSVLEKASGLKIRCTQNTHPPSGPEVSIERMQQTFSWKATSVLTEVRQILNARSGIIRDGYANHSE